MFLSQSGRGEVRRAAPLGPGLPEARPLRGPPEASRPAPAAAGTTPGGGANGAPRSPENLLDPSPGAFRSLTCPSLRGTRRRREAARRSAARAPASPLSNARLGPRRLPVCGQPALRLQQRLLVAGRNRHPPGGVDARCAGCWPGARTFGGGSKTSPTVLCAASRRLRSPRRWTSARDSARLTAAPAHRARAPDQRSGGRVNSLAPTPLPHMHSLAWQVTKLWM